MTHSEWAEAIVPIVKTNGSILICRDYKVTVNQASKLDNNSLPKTEVRGGQKFTKLDSNHIYQELLRDEENRKYTTIDICSRLLMYTRLPHRISSNLGILLAEITYVIIRLDDIFVKCKNDVEILKNLEKVLKRQLNVSLRLKINKCVFMVLEVMYCENEVTAGRVIPAKANV